MRYYTILLFLVGAISSLIAQEHKEVEDFKSDNPQPTKTVDGKVTEEKKLLNVIDSITPTEVPEDISEMFNRLSKLSVQNKKMHEELLKRRETESLLSREIDMILMRPVPDQSFIVSMYNNEFDVYIVDTRERHVGLYLKDKKKHLRSLGNLTTYLQSAGDSVTFAANAGMFKRGNDPQGLFVQKGKQLAEIDLAKEGYGNFYMQPNGVFFIDQDGKHGVLTTFKYDSLAIKPRLATQSGPMLVVDNKIHPAFRKGSENLNIRNGVGVLDQHRLVFIISRRPVNLYDFASLFRDQFGCKNALYLDGAISQSYVPGNGRLETGGNFGPMIGVSAKRER